MLRTSPFFSTFALAKGTIATRVVPGVNNTKASRHEAGSYSPSFLRLKAYLNSNYYGNKLLYFSRLVAGLLHMQRFCNEGIILHGWSYVFNEKNGAGN